MKDGKLTDKGKVGGLKETEIMELKRKQEGEINKEKCKSKIFQYLFSNQGKTEISIRDIISSIPQSIVMNLPEHFNDILQELLDDNKINGNISGDILILK